MGAISKVRHALNQAPGKEPTEGARPQQALTPGGHSGLPCVVRSSSRRWLSIISVLLVATMCFGTGLVEHSDDGCPIEIHCTVCVSHLTGLATQVSVASLAPVWSLDVALPAPTLSLGNTGTPSTLSLRGPPLT